MKTISRLNKSIEHLLVKFDSYPSDPTIPYFQRSLMRIREELSKPVISIEFLGGAAGGLSRIIHESSWADTPLGDEILSFLADLRKYRKSIEEK